MTSKKRFATAFLVLLYAVIPLLVKAQNPAFEQRRSTYITNALNNFDDDAITLQAYEGVPVDQAALNHIFSSIPGKSTIDFNIVQLVRVLCLSNGAYDSLILPALDTIPFWINYGDTLHSYWSENHMIMWMSSDWLLYERYGNPIDSSLRNRLTHYLDLKNNYGFYEFFSSTYAPYALSGLLNLADFAQDSVIKNKATLAAQRLLKDILMLTNDQGVYFPAAGRNYYGKYGSAYGQNHSHLIYLLTGMGPVPNSASHAGGFLASSSIDVDGVINSWTPELDTIYSRGHSLDSGMVLNQNQVFVDRIVFQWSSGAYFHPDVVEESVQLIVDSNIINHVDFEPLRPLIGLGLENVVPLATTFSVLSKSSLNSQEDVAIFKHHSITLASVQDFWKGKVGYQQFPLVANVNGTAIFPASGKPQSDWESRSSTNANTHLPYVHQQSNVALAMYFPEPTPDFLGMGFDRKEVALHWFDDDFDEIRESDLWLLGRKGDSYVGVRRACTGNINGVRACNILPGQTWVVIVGDSLMYDSFNNFQDIIEQSQFEEEWTIDTVAEEYTYYASIDIDTISIDYTWTRNSLVLPTGIENVNDNIPAFNIFPNPANEKITMDLSAFENQDINVKVINMIGQEVYENTFNDTNPLTVSTKSWQKGIYIVVAETDQKTVTKKLIIAD